VILGISELEGILLGVSELEGTVLGAWLGSLLGFKLFDGPGDVVGLVDGAGEREGVPDKLGCKLGCKLGITVSSKTTVSTRGASEPNDLLRLS
jgi:hypothetical protein